MTSLRVDALAAFVLTAQIAFGAAIAAGKRYTWEGLCRARPFRWLAGEPWHLVMGR